MSSPALTVPGDATRAQIAEMLTTHRISAAPVVDETGAVVGIVSEDHLLAEAGESAAELMTTAVVSVSVDYAVSDFRHLLVEGRIGSLPVLREGQLVGVVSRYDVVAMMATEWVCQVCGEPVRGERPPRACPKCQAGADRFTLQEQPPGH